MGPGLTNARAFVARLRHSHPNLKNNPNLIIYSKSQQTPVSYSFRWPGPVLQEHSTRQFLSEVMIMLWSYYIELGGQSLKSTKTFKLEGGGVQSPSASI